MQHMDPITRSTQRSTVGERSLTPYQKRTQSAFYASVQLSGQNERTHLAQQRCEVTHTVSTKAVHRFWTYLLSP